MVVYRLGSFYFRFISDFNLQYFKIIPTNFDDEVDVMACYLLLPFSGFSRRTLHTALALLWIIGLISGFFVGVYAGEYLSGINHIGICADGFGLLPVLLFRFLPLLFCLLSFILSRPAILFITVFFRAFFFSVAAASFYFASGGPAWLFSLFVFLGDAVILSSFWLILCCSIESRSSSQSVLLSIVATVMITLLDYLYIAPFMAKLI